MIRVLNLYAGLGGNRSGWPTGMSGIHEVAVTAVEFDISTARAYKHMFPEDRVVSDDALLYLEAHYFNYDFIWSSPPCPTHGQYRHNVGVLGKGYKPVMPDMSLYAQIVFLSTYFKGLWAVENVVPYYEPLIKPTAMVGRHLVWANFPIDDLELPSQEIRSKNRISDFGDLARIVEGSGITNKRQALRNLCDPRVGSHVWSAAMKARKEE